MIIYPSFTGQNIESVQTNWQNTIHRKILMFSIFQLYPSQFYRRVSVMRGQVITPQGLGIVGIRVSVDRDSRFGFTLTRAGGW